LKPEHSLHTRCDCATNEMGFRMVDGVIICHPRRCTQAATCYLQDGDNVRWICPIHAAQLKRGKNPLKWWGE
jgi:hypothetical protein